MSTERDRERLETILRVIADLDRRLGGMDFRTFSGDGDEIDLTAFRLSVIGENANKLAEAIKARNPTLPWKGMYGFRNLVSHEYAMIAPRFVWAATQELEPIEAMCRAELARIQMQRRERGHEHRLCARLDQRPEPRSPAPGAEGGGLRAGLRGSGLGRGRAAAPASIRRSPCWAKGTPWSSGGSTAWAAPFRT